MKLSKAEKRMGGGLNNPSSSFRRHRVWEWIIAHRPILFSFLTVRTIEWVHRTEGDVSRRGVHESGQRTSRRTAISIPGCGIGGQHCQNHIPWPISEWSPRFCGWSLSLELFLPLHPLNFSVSEGPTTIWSLRHTLTSSINCCCFWFSKHTSGVLVVV